MNVTAFEARRQIAKVIMPRFPSFKHAFVHANLLGEDSIRWVSPEVPPEFPRFPSTVVLRRPLTNRTAPSPSPLPPTDWRGMAHHPNDTPHNILRCG